MTASITDGHSLIKRSFKVSIRIDEKDLPVYDAKYDPPRRRVTGWIPSEAGKEFSIVLKQATSFDYTTSASIVLDGKTMSETVLGKGYDFRDCVNGCLVSSGKGRRFDFQQLELTDDSSCKDRNTNVKSLGTIVIRVYRVTVQPVQQTRRGKSLDKYITHIPRRVLKVPETRYKAGNHIIQLGREESVHGTDFTFTQPYGQEDRYPWVTFEFRYRPLERLQADGIAPRFDDERAQADPPEVIDLTGDD